MKISPRTLNPAALLLLYVAAFFAACLPPAAPVVQLEELAAAGTPVAPVPADRWEGGELKPGPIHIDSTWKTGEPGDTPYPHAVTTSGGFVFYATGQGIEVFDVSDPGRPVKGRYGDASQLVSGWGYWAHSDQDFFVTSIAAVSPELAATGARDFGFIVWNTQNKLDPAIHYQDGGSPGIYATSVYAVRLADGRDYAFVTDSNADGVAMYDLTAAALLSQCHENTLGLSIAADPVKGLVDVGDVVLPVLFQALSSGQSALALPAAEGLMIPEGSIGFFQFIDPRLDQGTPNRFAYSEYLGGVVGLRHGSPLLDERGGTDPGLFDLPGGPSRRGLVHAQVRAYDGIDIVDPVGKDIPEKEEAPGFQLRQLDAESDDRLLLRHGEGTSSSAVVGGRPERSGLSPTLSRVPEVFEGQVQGLGDGLPGEFVVRSPVPTAAPVWSEADRMEVAGLKRGPVHHVEPFRGGEFSEAFQVDGSFVAHEGTLSQNASIAQLDQSATNDQSLVGGEVFVEEHVQRDLAQRFGKRQDITQFRSEDVEHDPLGRLSQGVFFVSHEETLSQGCGVYKGFLPNGGSAVGGVDDFIVTTSSGVRVEAYHVTGAGVFTLELSGDLPGNVGSAVMWRVDLPLAGGHAVQDPGASYFGASHDDLLSSGRPLEELGTPPVHNGSARVEERPEIFEPTWAHALYSPSAAYKDHSIVGGHNQASPLPTPQASYYLAGPGSSGPRASVLFQQPADCDSAGRGNAERGKTTSAKHQDSTQTPSLAENCSRQPGRRPGDFGFVSHGSVQADGILGAVTLDRLAARQTNPDGELVQAYDIARLPGAGLRRAGPEESGCGGVGVAVHAESVADPAPLVYYLTGLGSSRARADSSWRSGEPAVEVAADFFPGSPNRFRKVSGSRIEPGVDREFSYPVGDGPREDLHLSLTHESSIAQMTPPVYYLAGLGSIYDGAKMRSYLWIYDISCIATASCGAGLPAPLAVYEVTDHSKALARMTTLSISEDRYLYVGNTNVGGACVARREYLLDMGRFDPASPPALAELDLGLGYEGWYYSECPTGFRDMQPRFAKVKDGYAYRVTWRWADSFEILAPPPELPALIFRDGFESGDLSAWSATAPGS